MEKMLQLKHVSLITVFVNEVRSCTYTHTLHQFSNYTDTMGKPAFTVCFNLCRVTSWPETRDGCRWSERDALVEDHMLSVMLVSIFRFRGNIVLCV
jgi:hypothetical protein